MPSIVWDRDPDEAYRNPYEYGMQEQFVREARIVIEGFHILMDRHNLHYAKDDVSLSKALWMLNYDALDALQDCLEMLQLKKHKLASRLFRDAYETLELIAYFNTQSEESKHDLSKWYEDIIIPNGRVRDQVKRLGWTHIAKEKADYYSHLSRFTHRSYKAILTAYSLGRDDLIVNDSHNRSGHMVSPNILSNYYPVLASLIKRLSSSLVDCGLVMKQDVDRLWETGLEKETVPRRFMEE